MPGPARLRSPRSVRERIDKAALAATEGLDRWLPLANEVRASIGRPSLGRAAVGQDAVSFLKANVGSRSAMYPVAKLKPLAGGGMNAVLRSRELVTDRDITVRRHFPAESAAEEAARRERDLVVRERLSQLPRHPVIPRFWASGSVDGEVCEVFDFAPGTSLAKFVEQKGLTYGQLLDFGWHAARGLQHLQRRRLIHADVKPENFCVAERTDDNGRSRLVVSLIDFDIVSSPEEQIRQYALGVALEGTLPYMPPENFRQEVPGDPDLAERMVFSKDVFALGMSLYRIAAAKFPESFYTSMEALLDIKVDGRELELDLPKALPSPLKDLIRLMVSSDWALRPSLRQVVSVFRRLRETATDALCATIVAHALEELDVQTHEQPVVAPPEHVGPYVVVDRNFAPRGPGDGQSLPLASLQDRFGRKLVGVPWEFESKEREMAFYEDRVAVLQDLNNVRVKHPELFPGSFRDLVREERDGRFFVWIVRPLLESAKDLTKFLAEERPDASVTEKLAILRRAAEALAVLEEAGYRLPRFGPELVFFVPLPQHETGTVSLTKAALTRPIQRLFDVQAKDPSTRWRQELMGTASVRRAEASEKDPTVPGFLDVAQRIRVFDELANPERNLLLQVASVDNWRERLNVLILIEMQRM